MTNLLEKVVEAPSTLAPGLPPGLDAIILRALERDPERRFSTARQMAVALEACVTPAIPAKVGEWVMDVARDSLAERAGRVAKL
jgi:serine/threonine-protein kinase